VKANGCREPPKIEYLPKKYPDDPTRVQRTTYAAGEKGVEVVLYTIEGHGHNWPGRPMASSRAGPSTREMVAEDVVWDFFSSHPKKQ
jgi:polyhydroxybutyrate depolymerase